MSVLQQKPNSVRPVDPNVLQRRASTPDVNVWVAASAGTGKTTVLTGRILRLLLPNAKNAACPPDKILALTFTKAGANEMALRLNKIVRDWAVMDETALHAELNDLLGKEPDKSQINEARKLFAKIVDLPGGMKIMTIHSFCSSVLARFPLEAELVPGFKALEDNQAREIQDRALYLCLEEAIADKTGPAGQAVFSLAQLYNEDQIRSAISNIISERHQFRGLLERHFSIEGYYTALCGELGIQPGLSKQEILQNAFTTPDFPSQDLRRAAEALLQGTEKTDRPNGEKLLAFLDKPLADQAANFQSYKKLFLTAEDQPLKNPITKKAGEQFSEERHILECEGARLTKIVEDCKSATYAANARDLFRLTERTLEIYTALKSAQGALDFDDLILKTLDLVQGRSMNISQQDASAWVMYKLDQGLDHILVDEAQDTNPEQWEIIRALSEEFFSGAGTRDDGVERTLFVVGDSKQSIFSFQRAAPEKFISMEDWFGEKIRSAGKTFESIPITISFRSVPAVLRAVDAVFAQPHVQKGLGRQVLEHISYTSRARQAGLVELWPLFKPKEAEDADEWRTPVDVIESHDPATQLAYYIAGQIDGWIKNKEILPKTGRPVQPGDILILMRKRTGGFVEKLVRALKLTGIPVSGVDRMTLKDQLAVQDLLAAARFALQPEDDLSLAEFLKSPFVGWDDDKLFEHAYGRRISLHQTVRTNANNKELSFYLDHLISMAEGAAPFDFFSMLLNKPCPADHISGHHAVSARLGEEATDPMEEFLNTSLDYEQDHPPSLQNFLQVQEQNEGEIKRDLEEGGQAVRIMTVHASKGLQAPIVIMPDTVRYPAARKADPVLWPQRSSAPLAVFTGTKASAPAKAQEWIESARALQDEEYRRLMYVAMTRAQDRLYIGGYQGKKPPMKESWYDYIYTGLCSLEECEEFDFGAEDGEEAKGLRLRNPSLEEQEPQPIKEETEEERQAALPEWIYKAAPEEPSPPRPLIPSRPAQEEQPVLSPAAGNAQDMARRFKRGNLIHKLLQLLPDVAESKRTERAALWLAQPGHDLEASEQEEIKNEVMKTLTDPVFAPVFAPGSLAEVPVTGLVDDTTLISGQIDRLIVTEDEVYIIDYKTNRPPPTKEEDVPALYRKQMEAYKRALEKIYPKKKIRCALLWTYGPFLMELYE